MSLYQPAGGRQPQPAPIPLALACIGAPVEQVEDMGLFRAGDAQAGIGDCQPDPASSSISAHRDGAVREAELDGVAEQIGEHLPYPFRISLHHSKRWAHPIHQAQIRLVDEWLELAEQGLHLGGEVDRLVVQSQLAAREQGEVHQIIRKRSHLPGSAIEERKNFELLTVHLTGASFREQAGESRDGGERRLELVRYRRQEVQDVLDIPRTGHNISVGSVGTGLF